MSDGGYANADSQAITSQAIEQLAQIKANFEGAKTEMATIKGAVEEIQRTTTADADTITRTKQEIEKLRTDASATATSVESELKGIKQTIGELEQRRDSLQSILADVEGIKIAAEANNSSVAEAVKAIGNARTAFETLQAQTQAAHEELERKRATVNGQIAEISKANAGVKEIHDALLSDTPAKKSVKTSINELQSGISAALDNARKDREKAQKELEELKQNALAEKNDLIAKTQKDFSDLRKSLNDQILSLLPSAGAAGLASTYYDAKSKYGVTPFHPGSGASASNGTIFQRMFAHDPTSFVATVFFYVMFLAPITIIIWLFYDLLEQIAVRAPGSLNDKYLILRALISIPLGTVSLFGYSSLRLYRRLYEEYNYKQRVMELYTSFSKEIDAKGDPEQEKALIAIMLKAVADKPAIGMHRYDGISQSGIKIDLNQIFTRLFGTAKA